MNERIKQLADEAAFTVGEVGSRDDFAKKFAELIAEECAGIAYRSSDSGDIAAMSILYEFNIDNARFQK